MTSIFIHKSKDAHYDLPLHQRLGTEFLVMLMALMTLLCLLATSTSITLGKALNQWTSGLENSLTLEVPSSDSANAIAKSIENALGDLDGVKRATRLTREDLSGLVAPWLGGMDSQLNDLPLPILIQVDLRERSPETLSAIRKAVLNLSSDVRIDAYEIWLTDLLRLTTTIRLIAFSLLIMILCITALTIAGAVRSRMAIHHDELRLLHIMGAEDDYIAKQFRNYILRLAGRGILIGCVVAFVLFGVFILMKPDSGLFFIGSESTYSLYALALLVPITLMAVSLITARQTVLRVLRAMP